MEGEGWLSGESGESGGVRGRDDEICGEGGVTSLGQGQSTVGTGRGRVWSGWGEGEERERAERGRGVDLYYITIKYVINMLLVFH